MKKRYLAIWFPQLLMDWAIRQDPSRASLPFALVERQRGRVQVVLANAFAREKGVGAAMSLADSRAICPDLLIMDYPLEKGTLLIKAWAEWAIRYTPVTAVDPPDGLILDASGCAHLWGGERAYVETILQRIRSIGYEARGAMADTIGAAWGLSRYGPSRQWVQSSDQKSILADLPVSALRLDKAVLHQLHQLGIRKIQQFMDLPRASLRRRWGPEVLTRLDQFWGNQWETLSPFQPEIPYQERLYSLEPINTAVGIRIAIEKLLASLCQRLEKESKGARQIKLSSYRVDHQVQQVQIHMSNPSRDAQHMLRLFQDRIAEIKPGLGIELFVMEAPAVLPLSWESSLLWAPQSAQDKKAIGALIDRIAGKAGAHRLNRYLPAGSHWPEQSFRPAIHLEETPDMPWPTHLPRPVELLDPPVPIEVIAPMPDYPPLLFRYQGRLHRISKGEGPERIEASWWQDPGNYRDYYSVEDQQGIRYWLFRQGEAGAVSSWFLHGWFA